MLYIHSVFLSMFAFTDINDARGHETFFKADFMFNIKWKFQRDLSYENESEVRK